MRWIVIITVIVIHLVVNHAYPNWMQLVKLVLFEKELNDNYCHGISLMDSIAKVLDILYSTNARQAALTWYRSYESCAEILK